MRVLGQYDQGTIGAVEEAMRRNGVPDEYMLDLGTELMDRDTPGGFGEDTLSTRLDSGLSTGGTIADILGKLAAGFAVGMSTRGGGEAAAAANFVRGLSKDQREDLESRRKGQMDRLRLAQENRRFGMEELKFSWEKKTKEAEMARLDPNSPETQVVRAAARKSMSELFGKPPTEESDAAIAQMNSDQIEDFVVQQGNVAAQQYKRERDLVADDFKRQGLDIRAQSAAATQALARSGQEQAAAQRETMNAIRQGQLDLRQDQFDESRRENERREAQKQADIYDKGGQPAVDRYLEMQGRGPGSGAAGPVPVGPVPTPAGAEPAIADSPQRRNALSPASQRNVDEARATAQAKLEGEERHRLPSMQTEEANLRDLKQLLSSSDTISGPLIGLMNTYAPNATAAIFQDRAQANLYVGNIAISRAKQLGINPTDIDLRATAEAVLNSYLPERDNMANIIRNIDENLLKQARARGQPQGPTPQIPTVRSDADYDQLPSGTRFTDPRGQVRVKP